LSSTGFSISSPLDAAGWINAPHGQQHMRVRLRRAVFRSPPVHIEIGNHPALHELLADKITREPDRLGLAQLAWQRDFDLARQYRIAALFDGGDLVPQGLAVQPAGGCLRRQQNF
jgi:hypothetical protein